MSSSEEGECSVRKCQDPVQARGWCRRHYKRWAAHGDPEYTKNCPRDLTPWQKIEWHGWTERVVRPELGPCWEFKVQNSQGYGRIWENHRSRGTHRISFEHFHGNVPPGEVVRHKCDNPPCLNPEHLISGTHADNVRDMDDRGRRYVMRGESHTGSRFTQRQVDEIRRLYREDGVSQTRIATLLDVQQSTVQKIVTGARWKETE